VRAHALLPAPQEGDARLVRHLRPAHMHGVHAPDRRRDKVSGRRQAPPRRPGGCHEDGTGHQEPSGRRGRGGLGRARGGVRASQSRVLGVHILGRARRVRVRGGNPDLPRRRTQRRHYSRRHLRRRHGDTLHRGPGTGPVGRGYKPHPPRRGGHRGCRRRRGEPPAL
ncbi:MAG: Rhomboid family membrane protein, partial [uncultured Rubrobacteraceae bacterium]